MRVLNIEISHIITDLVEWNDMCWGQHVDKCIANITFVLHIIEGKNAISESNLKARSRNSQLWHGKTNLKINGQIEKIISTTVIVINSS